MTKTTRIYYERLESLEHYNNVRVGIERALEPGDDEDAAFESLMADVCRMVGGHLALPVSAEEVVRLEQRLPDLREEYEDLKEKVQAAREWLNDNAMLVEAYQNVTGKEFRLDVPST